MFATASTVDNHSIRVRVSTRLKNGKILPWNGLPVRAEGTFAGFLRERDGTTTLALRVCNNDHLPSLFDARIVSVGEDSFTFTGVECVEGKWLEQEWVCRILSLQNDPYLPAHLRPKKART